MARPSIYDGLLPENLPPDLAIRGNRIARLSNVTPPSEMIDYAEKGRQYAENLDPYKDLMGVLSAQGNLAFRQAQLTEKKHEWDNPHLKPLPPYDPNKDWKWKKVYTETQGAWAKYLQAQEDYNAGKLTKEQLDSAASEYEAQRQLLENWKPDVAGNPGITSQDVPVKPGFVMGLIQNLMGSTPQTRKEYSAVYGKLDKSQEQSFGKIYSKLPLYLKTAVDKALKHKISISDILADPNLVPYKGE